MNVSICKQQRKLAVDVDAVCRLIIATQLPSGEIPWSTGAKTDPWDHVEAAMGLTVGGYLEQARRAFDWLRSMQLADGSWYRRLSKRHTRGSDPRNQHERIHRRGRVALLFDHR
jgi:squalene cyclase